MFSQETYVARRKRLIEQLGGGVVLLPGNEESPMNYPENTYRFRQDSSFLYFFGLDSPNLCGVIDADEESSTIFGEELTLDDVIWSGPQPSLRERSARVGVEEVQPLSRLGQQLAEVVGQGRGVHYPPPYRAEQVLQLGDLLWRSPLDVREGYSVPLVAAIVEQRARKTDEELAELERAVEVCHEMHTTAMRLVAPGRYEREIAGVLEGIAAARGGRLSFPTIFSVHGETLHNHHYDNVMAEGDIAICDAGAESPLHYAGDVTRTLPVGGEFTPKQRDVYELVLAAQTAAIEAMRPGVLFREVHRKAAEVLTAGLGELGMMKGDVGEAVAAGAHALFFPHGLGHLVGLDVHDMEGLGEDHVGYTSELRRSALFGWRSLRFARELEEGFVLTVEPGLYFIPALIDQWKAEGRHREFIDYDAVNAGYRDFGGVRLEDDVLVTASGSRVLGPPIPKTVQEVEATMAAR